MRIAENHPTMPQSMGYNMAGGTSNMLKKGHSVSEGVDEAVLKNLEAAKVLWCVSHTVELA